FSRDWTSDVCSSDLLPRVPDEFAALAFELSSYNRCERVPSYRRSVRNRAKAIIEGRQCWPRELFAWKLLREYQGYDCAWLDERKDRKSVVEGTMADA